MFAKLVQRRKKTSLAAGQHSDYLIWLKNVSKTYQSAAGSFTALNGIDFQAQAGEFIAIAGKSGSGKSTLLNILTGIDSPTSGEIVVGGVAVHTLNQDQLAVWRGRTVGVVFQFFQLLPTLTVVENVMLPMDFCNTFPTSARRSRAIALLEQVGVAEQADKLPSALSGGQQQRVAIARALANAPPIVIADEPTGNLDSKTADAVFQLFAALVEAGKTIVLVTHDQELARRADRIVTIADGTIVDHTVNRARRTTIQIDDGAPVEHATA